MKFKDIIVALILFSGKKFCFSFLLPGSFLVFALDVDFWWSLYASAALIVDATEVRETWQLFTITLGSIAHTGQIWLNIRIIMINY